MGNLTEVRVVTADKGRTLQTVKHICKRPSVAVLCFVITGGCIRAEYSFPEENPYLLKIL